MRAESRGDFSCLAAISRPMLCSLRRGWTDYPNLPSTVTVVPLDFAEWSPRAGQA